MLTLDTLALTDELHAFSSASAPATAEKIINLLDKVFGGGGGTFGRRQRRRHGVVHGQPVPVVAVLLLLLLLLMMMIVLVVVVVVVMVAGAGPAPFHKDVDKNSTAGVTRSNWLPVVAVVDVAVVVVVPRHLVEQFLFLEEAPRRLALQSGSPKE